MRNDFYDGIDETREDDDLGISKINKSAVLEVEEGNGEVIVADDADFESNDMAEEEDGLESGFALYEQKEEDDLSLQF